MSMYGAISDFRMPKSSLYQRDDDKTCETNLKISLDQTLESSDVSSSSTSSHKHATASEAIVYSTNLGMY